MATYLLTQDSRPLTAMTSTPALRGAVGGRVAGGRVGGWVGASVLVGGRRVWVAVGLSVAVGGIRRTVALGATVSVGLGATVGVWERGRGDRVSLGVPVGIPGVGVTAAQFMVSSNASVEKNITITRWRIMVPLIKVISLPAAQNHQARKSRGCTGGLMRRAILFQNQNARVVRDLAG